MEIEIIKDVITNSHYYAVYKSECDEADAKSIIAYAETELEVLKIATESIIQALKCCQKALEDIKTPLLERNEEHYLPEKFHIKKLLLIDENNQEYSSMCLMKGFGWVRDYR